MVVRMVVDIKISKKTLYYVFIFSCGIFGLLYFIFIPNLLLLFGSIIFSIIGFTLIISQKLKKELKFGFLGHISFFAFLFFLVSVYFIKFGTINDINILLYGILIAIGAVVGIFIGLYVNKSKSKIEKIP